LTQPRVLGYGFNPVTFWLACRGEDLVAVIAEVGLGPEGVGLRLLTQPRVLGYGFNPVTFWLACRGEDLVAVIAEVDNTFGDRHCYFCARPGFAPIGREDRLHAEKVFHVSPFQAIAGGYAFTFDIGPDRIDIRILHHNGERAAGGDAVQHGELPVLVGWSETDRYETVYG
ncbi:hypothetical protein CNY89_20715, partial [Amaricoccus sp. HAR-UPW-R2A-40]